MIYLDNAASTKVDGLVYKKMENFFIDIYGNPSAVYRFSQKSRSSIDDARKTIADIINCKSTEVYFTGSGTESNNWAIFGIAEAYKEKGKHIVTSKTEHSSIIEPVEELKRRGFEVTFLNVDRNGHIGIKELNKAINNKTILVSIGYANNEIGTVENISGIGEILHSKNIPFHTDACQAAGFLDINVNKMKVDLMTINGSKIYGPKGAGALYVNEKIKITPLIYGGGQERRMRGGTENVPGIIGLAEALRIAEKMRLKESGRLTKLRDNFIQLLKAEIKGVHLNGDPVHRLPNNINISFEGVESESMLLRLDMAGICASAGAACTSGAVEPSHVLLGIGLGRELAKSSLRFSLGRETTWKELQITANILKKTVRDLRKNKQKP